MKKIAFVASYMGLIAFLSLAPMDAGAKQLRFLAAVAPDIQNLMHVPAYALLAVLWMQVLTQWGRRDGDRVAATVCAAVGFGLVVELAQVFIPGRYASLTDGLVNTLGACLGVLVYLGVERCSPGRIRRLICT